MVMSSPTRVHDLQHIEIHTSLDLMGVQQHVISHYLDMQTISKTKDRKSSIKAAPPPREERATARTIRAAAPVSLATRKRLAQAAAAAATPASAAASSAQKAKKDNGAEDYVVVRHVCRHCSASVLATGSLRKHGGARTIHPISADARHGCQHSMHSRCINTTHPSLDVSCCATR